MTTRINDSTKRLDPRIVRAVYFDKYPNHDTIWAMCRGADGRIYIGLCSEGLGGVAQLCAYDPRKDKMSYIADMGEVTGDKLADGKLPQCKIHFSLCPAADGMIYGATHMTAPAPDESVADLYGLIGNMKHGYSGGFIFAYDPAAGKTECLGLGAPFEGIRCMIFDQERSRFYGITFPRVHLFSFDLKSRERKDLGRIGNMGAFSLFLDKNGRVYGSNDFGKLYRYDPRKDEIEGLSIEVPKIPWRGSPLNFLFHNVEGPDGKIYGDTYFDGYLFRYDPYDGHEGKIESLGKGWGDDNPRQWFADYIQDPVFGTGPNLYYGIGTIWQRKYLVRLNVETMKRENLGYVLKDGLESGCFGGSTAGEDGRTLYLGEATLGGPARLLIVTPEMSEAERKKVTNRKPRKIKSETQGVAGFDLTDAEKRAGGERQRLSASAFITEGSLAIRELNFHGVSPVIPYGETAIMALCMGSDGKIYGATGGTRAHLFVYDPFPTSEQIIDIGTIEEEASVCNALVTAYDGTIYGGTMPGGILFRYDPSNDFSVFLHYGVGKIEDCGKPVEGDAILTLTTDNSRRRIYGLTKESGTLFSFDTKIRRFAKLANLNPKGLSRVLIEGPDGKIYGAERDGALFRFDPSSKKIERPSLRLPSQKGAEHLNGWDAAVITKDKLIYGGTLGGYLFRLDVEKMEITCIGKPLETARIRGLALSVKGKLYGIGGEPGFVSRLFVYDSSRSEIKDLGVPAVNFPKFWIGYEFDSVLAGPYGRIYLGESDRISHLFIYYPPV